MKRKSYFMLLSLTVFLVALAHFTPSLSLLAQESKSIDEYKSMVDKNPKNAAALNNLGAALIQAGQYSEAVQHLIKSIEVEPANARAHYNLGFAYHGLEKYNEASGAYQRAIQYGFKNYRVCYNLGLVLEELGKVQEAKLLYRESVKMKSDFGNAYFNLAEINKKLNENDEAIANYRQYLSSNPGAADKAEVQDSINALESGNISEKDNEKPAIKIFDPVARGLKIQAKNDVSILLEVQSPIIELSGLASDKSGVSRVLIRNQEARLSTPSEDEKGQIVPSEQAVKFSAQIPLSLGINEVSVAAVDVFDNKNEKIIKIMRKEFQSEFYSNSWAILVGIDEFEKEPWRSSPLTYASKDAIEMTKILKEEFGFKKENMTLLLDKRSLGQLKERDIAGTIDRANLSNIKNAMSTLTDTNRVKLDDRVLIFFAGHGQTMSLPDGGEMGFIIPEDGGGTSLGDYYNTTLPMREINDRSMMIPAKHILFLVDACYSGLTSITSKGVNPSITITKLAGLKAKELITAGGAGEVVVESSQWGHSAFTFTLLNGLRTGVADSNNDGYITADELGSYLRNRVPEIAEGRQVPRHTYFFGEGEFIFELPR